MNKVLWKVLDGIKLKYEDIDITEFCDKIEQEMEGYIVEAWDHEDYELCDLPEETIHWINDRVKGKTVEDLQVDTYVTDDDIGDEAYFTVVAIKIKED